MEEIVIGEEVEWGHGYTILVVGERLAHRGKRGAVLAEQAARCRRDPPSLGRTRFFQRPAAAASDRPWTVRLGQPSMAASWPPPWGESLASGAHRVSSRPTSMADMSGMGRMPTTLAATLACMSPRQLYVHGGGRAHLALRIGAQQSTTNNSNYYGRL